MEKPNSAAYLVWEDLTVVLPYYGNHRSSKKLIHGMRGYAVPGRIMAVMGPSGSGKSTLLDSLAGRLGNNVVMTGKVLLNGQKRRLDNGSVLAYVTQENTLLGTLTVRETISYSARLRLPSGLSKEEVTDVVEGTIHQMGLVDCADRQIGNWHLRGISGGEKKRLSIALEIVTNPILLFLDEPTTGLDSASAFFVALTLRQMARDGKTIVSSIHQPSGDVFALFDDLCLLSGGQTVYFGDAKLATEFFARAGFRCPSHRNPSDHFLRCINTDFDRVNATLKESRRNKCDSSASSDPLMNMETSKINGMLIDRYMTSDYATLVRKRISDISQIEGLSRGAVKGSQAGWWKQLGTLTARSSVNMYRDMGYYRLRIVVYVLLAICVGTVFFDIGTSYTSILARASCGCFITGFMTFMSIGGFPSFIEEMKVFQQERLNGHYGVAVYTISNFLSSAPFLLVIALVPGTIIYYMAKFHPGFLHYVYFAVSIFICMAVVESLMMVIASLVPNFLMGVVTGAGVMGIMLMAAGFFRFFPDLPKVIWRYPISYISYGAWGLQGQFKNDLIGLEFDSLAPGGPKLSGEYILTKMYGISIDHSKWLDLGIIVVMLVSYRILFFLLLKFKEKAKPVFRFVYAKTTV